MTLKGKESPSLEKCSTPYVVVVEESLAVVQYGSGV
jgi:hypothetical protein